KDKYAVFQLGEENLNSLIAPKLKSELVIFAEKGIKNLIFDLSNVRYVDSSGLSAILTANRLWKGQGSFVLTGIEHPNVKRLIEISRLDTILNIQPSVEDAINVVHMEELQREIQDTTEE
ncbi:MAG: anti-sigma factor antagonist, partial [Bacteroidetes bacterium]